MSLYRFEDVSRLDPPAQGDDEWQEVLVGPREAKRRRRATVAKGGRQDL